MRIWCEVRNFASQKFLTYHYLLVILLLGEKAQSLAVGDYFYDVGL